MSGHFKRTGALPEATTTPTDRPDSSTTLVPPTVPTTVPPTVPTTVPPTVPSTVPPTAPPTVLTSPPALPETTTTPTEQADRTTTTVPPTVPPTALPTAPPTVLTYPPGSCQRLPCKNGGTCYDQPGGTYLCVCPKCGCSSAKPFGDCIIDTATICKKEDLPPGNLVPHPYLCNKFYDCKPYVTYKREQNVYMHENHVFNSYTDDSDFPDNVDCAEQIPVKVCADITCANGGNCTNNQGGFMCDCAPGYKGKTCDLEWCSGDYCQNGGTCIDTTGGAKCICPSNYTGLHCGKGKYTCLGVS
ncbi:hypothetical protein LSAT2_030826 [Lamellibrachia satsuma]|nr:hypothetical protein LSAT2_030826 [Lamellibrachia satsuma]